MSPLFFKDAAGDHALKHDRSSHRTFSDIFIPYRYFMQPLSFVLQGRKKTLRKIDNLKLFRIPTLWKKSAEIFSTSKLFNWYGVYNKAKNYNTQYA